MGKSAKNEQLKIRATYFNNTAVGMTVTAVVIPALTAYQQYQKFIMSGYPPSTQQGFNETWAYIIGAFASMVFAAFFAVAFKHKAHTILENIED